jgi:hypothetical protein
MANIYTPAVRPVRYTGDFPYPLREIRYARFEPMITLEAGDIVFLPLLVAQTIVKRKRRLFEAVENLELEGHIVEIDDEDEGTDEVLQQTNPNLTDPIDLNGIDTTALMQDDAGDADEKSETQTVKGDEQASSEDAENAGEENVAGETDTETLEDENDETVITKENIMDESVVSLKMIKEACKAHKITIGRKGRNDLVALLLPYLDN